MKVWTERKSGIFLKKFGFGVVRGFYISNKDDLKNAVEKIGFPCVVKVFGEKIIHKKKIGGVVLGINSYEKLLNVYEDFKKIKGAEGVVVQPELQRENEFLVGVQKTADFGHVVAFGVGGSNVEKIKKVNFRVCPFEKKDALELVNENFDNLSREKKKVLVGVLLKCCKLIKRFSKIEELDINPLIISKGKGIVLDSRIVFE